MKIHEVALQSATLNLSSADLYTLANSHLNVTGRSATGVIQGVFYCEAVGATIMGSLLGGTSEPVKQVQPSYYPKAIQGAECGAQISDLSWADKNLYDGYQFIPTGRGFFVSGVLNSTQTDANDPFTAAEIVAGNVACWDENYEPSIMDF